MAREKKRVVPRLSEKGGKDRLHADKSNAGEKSGRPMKSKGGKKKRRKQTSAPLLLGRSFKEKLRWECPAKKTDYIVARGNTKEVGVRPKQSFGIRTRIGGGRGDGGTGVKKKKGCGWVRLGG